MTDRKLEPSAGDGRSSPRVGVRRRRCRGRLDHAEADGVLAGIGQDAQHRGITLRVWDSIMEAWRVTGINPATGARDEGIGRRSGKHIVQVDTHADGTPMR